MRVDVPSLVMSNAAAIAAAGIDAIRSGDTRFDLSAVQNCDSSAGAVVLAWQREAQVRGAHLQVSALPPGLLSLATVYGVEPLLQLDPAS